MLTFEKLWNNHPTIAGNQNPCATNGRSRFMNQCAIRVGVSLRACAVDTSRLAGVRHCWYHDKSEGHVLAAEELANGLRSTVIPGLAAIEYLASRDSLDEVSGRKGIIFFKDYWRRTINGRQESLHNRSGDHIDLWNGTNLTGGDSREQLTSMTGNSKEIWFWRVIA